LGSNFLTIDEAARRLNRHRRSIMNYLDKGFLKKVVRGRNVLISTEDVEQLAIELGSDSPAMNRKAFFEMQSRLKKLEEKMSVVEHIWGSQESPLRPNQKEAAGMYKAVTDYLTVASYKYQEMESWAGLFNRIDEKTLEAIAEHSLTTNPWAPYFELATRMVNHIDSKKELKTSLLLQACRAKLEAGRRKVREAALFWIESGRVSVPQKLFQLLDTPKEDLLRVLTSPKQAN
jgi:excisionase family DNA binding protein